ncbi:MAG: sigma-70 family RNA polymerase sigma factor [Deltaproteobacteria bacterium]|nr:sigma-70 family RNA polymerase sigma factor [Deltaproteobacteria bacterium]
MIIKKRMQMKTGKKNETARMYKMKNTDQDRSPADVAVVETKRSRNRAVKFNAAFINWHPRGKKDDDFLDEYSDNSQQRIEDNDLVNVYFKDMGRHNLIDRKKEQEIYRNISLRKAEVVRILLTIPLVHDEVFRLSKEIRSGKTDIRSVIHFSRQEDESHIEKMRGEFLAMVAKVLKEKESRVLSPRQLERDKIAGYLEPLSWNDDETKRIINLLKEMERIIRKEKDAVGRWGKAAGFSAKDVKKVLAALGNYPEGLHQLSNEISFAHHELHEFIEFAKKKKETIAQVEQKVGISHLTLSRSLSRILNLLEENRKSKEILIESNLRLVIKLAQRYVHRGLHLLDLIQEGNIGLIKAVERFEYERGNKFSTYASWWIKQSINRAIADQGNTVRIPVHLTEALYRFNKVRRSLSQTLAREPYLDEIAQKMSISVSKARALRLLSKFSRNPISLETPIGDNNDSTLEEVIESTNKVDVVNELSKEEQSEEVRKFLSALSPREEKVIRMRFGIGHENEHTLEEVGRIFGLTRERIRQIEKEALRKLRDPINEKLLSNEG